MKIVDAIAEILKREGVEFLSAHPTTPVIAMGGYAERVEKPAEIAAVIECARKMNAEGKAVLLEFITSEEITFSHRRGF